MDLSGLNPEQRKAAETLSGPVLVLAGAGSGKTRALTYRVANLIDHGVAPWHILALTFTNKAAREMKSRVEQLVGEDAANQAWISTFHSTCARILRKDIEKIGYTRNFAIYDDDDQSSLIKGILKELNIDDKFLPVRQVKGSIGDAKNRLLSPDEWFQKSSRDRQSSLIHDCMILYEKKMKAMNALDFDDLLNKTLELLLDHPPVLEYYRNRFEYVLVDEYQDTNKAQYELVRLITLNHRNLCVVGDDDQSIYGWRGADLRNILDFEKDYPDAKVIKLEQNYRSTGNILDAANQVIAHNEGRKDKKLWTEQEAGEKIHSYCATDEQDEAAWVASVIQNLRRNGVSAGEIAILYRTNAQSRVAEEMLMRAGIPYRIFGGQKFYERKEIRDILSYLRSIVNPADDMSLQRIINVPKRGIGEATVQQLADYAARNGMPLYGALSDLPDSLGNRARKTVGAFFELMTLLSVMKDNLPLTEFVDFLIDQAGLEQQYAAENTEEARSRMENIAEFRGAVHAFAELSEEATLEDYLENVALVTDLDRSGETRDYITLMTLHSAKGLEFDYVFIVGTEENIFPSSRSLESETRMEEERRLMYVGITRARRALYLTRASERMLYNQFQHNAPSRFVEEIPDRLIEEAGNRRNRRPAAPRYDAAGSGRYGMPFRGVPARGVNRAPAAEPFADEPVRGSLPPRQPGKPKLTLNGRSLDRIPGVTRGFSGGNAAPAAQAPEKAGALETLFTPGERVMHPKFGPGTVTELSGSGASARIRVSFDRAGERELSLAVAPIVRYRED